MQYECTSGSVPVINSPILMSATLQDSGTSLGAEFRKDVYLDITSNIALGTVGNLAWLDDIQLLALPSHPLASPFEHLHMDSGPHSVLLSRDKDPDSFITES